MNTFPQLIRQIRKSAKLTQSEFADCLEVSTPLIAMIETGQKEVSKNFILKLSNKLDVHPSTITPFLFIVEGEDLNPIEGVEKMFVKWGEKMQKLLITKKAKNLSKLCQK